MTFYTCGIVLTELLMLAMTLHVVYYSGFTKQQKTWFLLTFFAIMLCSGAEFAVHGIAYRPAWATPLTILTVLQFSISPLLGVLFSGALGLHRQARFASVFFSLNLLAQISAAPFGLVFYFNEEGYSRGECFIIYEAFYMISLLYLVGSMIKAGRRFRHRDARTIVMVIVVLIAGIIPMTVYKLNITYLAIAISASLCYIYYNDLVQQDIKSELVDNQEQILRMQENTVSGLANLIESRDLETGTHVARTSAYVKALCEFAKQDGVYEDALNEQFDLLLYKLAPLHDVGKIVVSDQILKKPAKLTPEEFEEMKRHASEGGRVVRQILNGITDEEYIAFAQDIATYHHERWDGSGYPEGLSGENIPLCARIMAFADVFDALVSERCYKRAMPAKEAFKVIEAESGTHFDPKLAKVFLDHKEVFAALANEV